MTPLHFHKDEFVQVVNEDKITQNIRVIEFITELTAQERGKVLAGRSPLKHGFSVLKDAVNTGCHQRWHQEQDRGHHSATAQELHVLPYRAPSAALIFTS